MGTGDSPDFSDATWKRMSATGVEVAMVTSVSGEPWFGVRNSAHPDDLHIYNKEEWIAFVAGAKSNEFDYQLSERGFRRLCRGWREPHMVDRDTANEAADRLVRGLKSADQDPTRAQIAQLLLNEDLTSYQAVADRLALYISHGPSNLRPLSHETVGVHFRQIRSQFIREYRQLAQQRNVPDQLPVTGLTPPPAGDRTLTSRVLHRRRRLRDMTPAELLGLDEGATVNAEVYARMVTSTVNSERVRQRTQHAAAIEMFFAVDDGDNPPAQTTIAAEVGLSPAAISHTLGTARAQIARGYANLTGQRSRYAPPGRRGR